MHNNHAYHTTRCTEKKLFLMNIYELETIMVLQIMFISETIRGVLYSQVQKGYP